MEDNLKLLIQTTPITRPTPPDIVPKSTYSCSTPVDPGSSRRHIRFSTPPSSPFDKTSEVSLLPEVARRVRTRSDSPPSALAILAAVCSSPRVHWDGRKHRYAESHGGSLRYEGAMIDTSRHAHIVDPSSPTSSLSYPERPFTFRDRIKEVEVDGEPEVQKISTVMEVRYPVDEDDEDDLPAPQTSGGLDYLSEFSPSSPTTLAVSSPLRDFSSASDRSMTLPLSSPGPLALPTPMVDTVFSAVQNVTMGAGLRGNSGASPLPSEFGGSCPLLRGVEAKLLGMKAEPLDVVIPGLECTKKVTFISEGPDIHNPVTQSSPYCSPSPLRAPEPLPRSSIDFALSPLSSLVSSPLSEIMDERPSSPAPSHFSVSSSVISARSASPDAHFSDSNSPIERKVGGRRASINIIGINARPANGIGTAAYQQRSDTAPPEPTPRKRRRPSSPFSPSARTLQTRRISSSTRSPSPPSKHAATSSMGLEENRPWRHRTKAKKQTPLASISCASAPKQSAKRKKSKTSIPKSEDESPSEETDLEPLGSSYIELAALPMAGFLVETLALSRASAMTAPELLRAVLKSQPHLMEERDEKLWLVMVRRILQKVRMFGRIERKGTDAADRPLEDQWFYIPENDDEDGRAELLKGLMPKKRNVTKQSKQYYFEPVQKVSRWDPEDD